MLLLAAAYCVHRAWLKRCGGGGKSTPNEGGAKRVAL